MWFLGLISTSPVTASGLEPDSGSRRRTILKAFLLKITVRTNSSVPAGYALTWRAPFGAKQRWRLGELSRLFALCEAME
jgi:hypothetical protein